MYLNMIRTLNISKACFVLVTILFVMSNSGFSQDTTEVKRGTIRIAKIDSEEDKTSQIDSLEEDSVKKIYDREAFYVGGKAKMQVYLMQNMIYPDIAKREKIAGYVNVEFVVDEFGQINYVQEKDYSNAIFINEAIRLIENMPNWSPAMVNGSPVASKVVLKVEFFLPLLDVYED